MALSKYYSKSFMRITNTVKNLVRRWLLLGTGYLRELIFRNTKSRIKSDNLFQIFKVAGNWCSVELVNKLISLQSDIPLVHLKLSVCCQRLPLDAWRFSPKPSKSWWWRCRPLSFRLQKWGQPRSSRRDGWFPFFLMETKNPARLRWRFGVEWQFPGIFALRAIKTLAHFNLKKIK